LEYLFVKENNMKHLLNNLSEQEKNSIREQHTGGMKVMVENFSKLINSKLGDVKTLVNEAPLAPEPVMAGSRTAKVFFPKEGQSKLTPDVIEEIKRFLTPSLNNSKKVIEKYYKTNKIPKFITIGAGTTSGGSSSANDAVAQKRIAEVVAIAKALMVEMGYNDEIIRKFLTTNSDYDYAPTSVDSNLYDRSRVKPLDKERYVYIKIDELKEEGLDKESIGDVEDLLKIARGMNFNPDEEGIAQAICALETLSDIKDLDYELRDYGGLQAFINQTITAGLTTYDDDSQERKQIAACLNRAAKNSVGGRSVANIVGDSISIMLN